MLGLFGGPLRIGPVFLPKKTKDRPLKNGGPLTNDNSSPNRTWLRNYSFRAVMQCVGNPETVYKFLDTHACFRLLYQICFDKESLQALILQTKAFTALPLRVWIFVLPFRLNWSLSSPEMGDDRPKKGGERRLESAISGNWATKA